MTALDVKEKLARILDAVNGMKVAQRNLEQAENLLTGISIDYSQERVSSSHVSFDRIGDQVDQLARLRQEFAEKRQEATDRMIEGLRMLNLCKSARSYEILSRRYIQGEPWEKIEEEMHYSKRQLLRIQADALDEIADVCHPDVT